MKKSTDLTDELKSKKMVKIYCSFIRIIIQAIRYSGGKTRQFTGDVSSNIERGKVIPSLKLAYNIAKELDVCICDLFDKP